ncbi:hypothetical protein [Haladaptatus sp. DFWS20]|uniref:hypothetical protein n=1 Tax=Haladaptatus sp. DFWS20 TaxID=3403467 RepID=UPI003EB90F3F
METATGTSDSKQWAWGVTFGSVVLAALLHFIGGSSVEQIAGLFMITAILGAV